MLNKRVFIADFYYPEMVGGAELNDLSLISRLATQKNIGVEKLKSAEVTLDTIKQRKNSDFIVSNFVLLSKDVLSYLANNCSYTIYEHDHKYLMKRNPIFYKNFLAPKDHLANFDFYKNAQSIVCLTKLAEDVLRANTGLENVTRIGSSVWLDEDLDFINQIRKSEKKDCYAIMNSDNPIKKKFDCIRYCKKNNLKYELISDRNHKNFLEKLSHYKGLIFMTGHLETCCRIVVEAKMLGLEVITQKKLIGAASEDSFSLNGENLVEEMRKVSKNSVDLFCKETV